MFYNTNLVKIQPAMEKLKTCNPIVAYIKSKIQ
jgi:hypothetical protein